MKFDAFFSYHWQDHAAVEKIARELTDHGLSVFLDRWYLIPGQPWPQELERIIRDCAAVAVFIGPTGLGRWQQREKDLALNRQAQDPAFPVIPVLLPKADPALDFLGLNTWVDFGTGSDRTRAIQILEAAIRGTALGPDGASSVGQTHASICPYRGLQPFREEDAAFFCGREAFTNRLFDAVATQSLLAVVGPSGSGKSSVVRAGLIPRLRNAEGDLVWDFVTVLPTDRPLYSLAAALVPMLEPELSELDRLKKIGTLAEDLQSEKIRLRDVLRRSLDKQPGTNRLLLFVDQWEELYTLCTDDSSRQKFISAILEASNDESIVVVFTMRGDFYSSAIGDRALGDRLEKALINIGPMTRTELEAAITEPAAKAGLDFEPGLVDLLLDDVGEEPGNLPLLEFVLTQLWERRRGATLHHEAYESIGRLKGAIAARADQVFARLTNQEKEAAKWTLIQLVRPGAKGQDTRERAPMPVNDTAALAVIRRLADARLLTTAKDFARGEETVEVTHEALIHTWPTLKTWVDDNRALLEKRTRVDAAAALWESELRPDSRLLQKGRPLDEGRELINEAPDGYLSERLKTFTAASIKKNRRRKVRIVAYTALGSVIVLIISVVSLRLAINLENERDNLDHVRDAQCKMTCDQMRVACQDHARDIQRCIESVNQRRPENCPYCFENYLRP